MGGHWKRLCRYPVAMKDLIVDHMMVSENPNVNISDTHAVDIQCGGGGVFEDTQNLRLPSVKGEGDFLHYAHPNLPPQG